MIGEELIVEIGKNILTDPAVQFKIHAVVLQGLNAVIVF